jgi:F-type H+-transporting ATPase subunit b
MHLLAFAESIQLFPDGTLFVHIALILLMIWILNRTFFRPINRIIESREKFKGGRNTEADEILSSVAEKQSLYSQELLGARTQSYELIEKERTAALALRADKITGAKSETAKTFEAQRQELTAQADAARASIAKEAEVLAEKISSNILKA